MNTISMLIESELEKAEVVLDTKSIADRLQRMVEDIAQIEAEDIIPMMGKLRSSYGEAAAEEFKSVVSEKLRAAIDCLGETKDVITNQVDKLEGILDGNFTAPADPLPSFDMVDTFRESLRLGVAPVEAARAIAEIEGMDYADVVAAIKEQVVDSATKRAADQLKKNMASKPNARPDQVQMAADKAAKATGAKDVNKVLTVAAMDGMKEG